MKIENMFLKSQKKREEEKEAATRKLWGDRSTGDLRKSVVDRDTEEQKKQAAIFRRKEELFQQQPDITAEKVNAIIIKEFGDSNRPVNIDKHLAGLTKEEREQYGV